MKKPNTPKGTRDFAPNELKKRQYIIRKIKEQFQRFAFEPIETPAMERLDTLTGKYGDEGDRLIFKILNSGNFLRSVKQEDWDEKDPKKWIPKISEKALRYDLTVPFARYVAQHFHELNMPFKRYQIQPVWRADNPQKGRFREFHQCDADVIGTESLWTEVDLIMLYDGVFNSLGLPVELEINNRKILAAMAEFCKIESQLTDFTVALDKLDKIGEEGVMKELESKSIMNPEVEKVLSIFQLSNDEQLTELKSLFIKSELGQKGIDEVEFIQEQVQQLNPTKINLKFNASLARGLDYYTGSIFEAKVPGIGLGSIGAGGRYDNLTGIFGIEGLSGVGISFGLDRIYLAMESMNLLEEIDQSVKIMFTNFGISEAQRALQHIQKLRKKSLHCYLYPDEAKFKKQFQYANKCNYDFVAIIGEEELKNNQIALKNMRTGEQINLDENAFMEFNFKS